MMHKHGEIGAWYNIQTQFVHIRKHLRIAICQQQRNFYPPGENAQACCSERRTIAKVVGELLTERDIMKTAAALSASTVVLKSPHRVKAKDKPETLPRVPSPTPRPGLPFLSKKGIRRRVEEPVNILDHED